MSYHQLIQRLHSVNLHGGIKLGLDNCLRLNEALEFPAHAFPSIHIAGTNGKGSVTLKIATALQATGLQVGLYTSPHIACFRERIRINNEMISEENVQKHLSHLFQLTEKHQIPATFFELTTLLAFAYYAEKKVDVAVIETGLGGRLDATNILKPKLSIITSISLDHTEILGATIEQIALEKAGIIKPSIPVVIGPRVPVQIVEAVAKKNFSKCIVVEGIYHNFQDENNAIAKAALSYMNIPDEAIQKGLQTSPPCRFQTWDCNQLAAQFPNIPVPKALILDVAHNPDGIIHLLSSIKNHFPSQSIRFIIGLSKNKDLLSCLNLLKNVGCHFHLVEASNNPRASSKEVLQNCLLSIGIPISKISLEESVFSAITNATHSAGQLNQIVVACGTFFIMAEARAALGLKEPQDFYQMNEAGKLN